jgi:PAS domain S-box-containing protein
MDGIFLNMNQAGAQSIGYRPEELLNTNILEIIDPNYRSQFNEYIREIKEKGTAEGILKVISKQGKKHFWLFKNSLLNGINGEPYVLGSALDITDRIATEKELISAKKIAEESVVLKETFLANMSHEIRTPMNAIIGFTDILSKRNLGEQEKQFIETIKSSGETLLRIINDILDASKIEANMMAFEEHPLSIRELFKSLDAMLSAKAKEKNIQISFETDSAIPNTLLGDPTRLTQILINLIGNAIKFTLKGSVNVSAKVINNNNEKWWLEFHIKDSGIGIPADTLQHIFERFRQAESQTTRKYGGTGLGLSIAKQLVELQGGQMFIESVVNLGSVFSFTLPFKIPAKNQKIILADSPANFKMEKFKGVKVLLAEDNPVNVKLILTLFSDYGILIDVVNNGNEVVERLKNKSFDMVLMDMEMPEKDGYEAAAIIRKKLKNQTPIIAMTAHAMAGVKEKCLSFGMNDYISKPINSNLLFEKMYAILNTPAAVSTENKICDLNYLIDIMQGKKDVIKETLDLITKQVPKDLLVINNAVERIDYLAIKQCSHKMKSAVTIVGITGVYSILDEIEILGESQKDIEKIKSLNQELNAICKKAMTELEIEKLNFV